MLAPVGDDYFFDVVGVEELTRGRPLSTITIYLLHKMGLVSKLDLDEERLENFVLAIEEGYNSGAPYHCALRGADVVSR
eukprot:scaffold343496_cov36-Prasinocladus_malaysianus.AAC.1